MSDQSFGKSKRLLKNWQFRSVYAQGQKRKLDSFSLQWLKVSADQQTRVGLSVGRKVANAVYRNRVKRRLRELIRTYPQPSMTPGYWLVIAAKPEILTKDCNALRKELYLNINEILKQKSP